MSYPSFLWKEGSKIRLFSFTYRSRTRKPNALLKRCFCAHFFSSQIAPEFGFPVMKHKKGRMLGCMEKNPCRNWYSKFSEGRWLNTMLFRFPSKRCLFFKCPGQNATEFFDQHNQTFEIYLFWFTLLQEKSEKSKGGNSKYLLSMLKASITKKQENRKYVKIAAQNLSIFTK